MATWEDGPEYAPAERPDFYTEPTATPLALLAAPGPSASVGAQPTKPVASARSTNSVVAAEGELPGFAGPPNPGPQLADLVPAPSAQRDATRPFAVVSSTLTAGSTAWSAQQSSFGQYPSPGQPPAAVQYSQPGRYPQPGQYPVSSGPLTVPPGQSQLPPGSQQLPPAPQQPPGQQHRPPLSPERPPTQPPSRVGPQSDQPPINNLYQLVGPGLLIALLLGAFIWDLAPVTLAIAYALSGRMRYGRRTTRLSFLGLFVALTVVGVFTFITSYGIFTDWWHTLSQLAGVSSWVMLVIALSSASSERKRERQG